MHANNQEMHANSVVVTFPVPYVHDIIINWLWLIKIEKKGLY